MTRGHRIAALALAALVAVVAFVALRPEDEASHRRQASNRWGREDHGCREAVSAAGSQGRACLFHDPPSRRRARRRAAGDLARAGRHGPHRGALGPAR